MEASIATLVARTEGREVIKEIIEEVQLAVEPAELELSPVFIEPLLDAAVRGETVKLDSSDEAGRFGRGDWMFVVIVPLVVDAMERLLCRHAELEPGGSISDSLVNEVVTPEEVLRIVRYVGSSYAKTQVEALTLALRRSLTSRGENFLKKVDSSILAQALPSDRPLFLAASGGAFRRFDPFIFPSETRGHFRMLVVAALLVAFNLALVAVDVGRGKVYQGQLSQILGELGGQKTNNYSNTDRAALEGLRRKYHNLSRVFLETVTQRLLIPLQVVALLGALAFGIYVRHPRRIRRLRCPQTLGLDRAPTVVSYLLRCADSLGLPWLQIEHRPAFGDGQAYGLRGHEVLLLFGNPDLLEQGWQSMFKLIALHELGHLVNRDAADREKARAVWRALLLALGVGLAVLAGSSLSNAIRVTSEHGASTALVVLGKTAWNAVALGWPLVVLLVITRLIQAGLIRSREFYADWRVASWGFGGSLDQLLQIHERRHEGRWQRWWGLHPSCRLRRAALANPNRLFRVSLSLAFVTGVLFMVILTNGFKLTTQLSVFISALTYAPLPSEIQPDSSFLFLNVLRLLGTPTLFFICTATVALSYLVTSVLGVQVQREAMADLADGPSHDWGYLRLLAPALLLSLGIEAGDLLVPFSALRTMFARPVLLPVLLGGLTFFTWLWLVYIRAATRLILGCRPGGKDPRYLRWFVLSSAVPLLIVLYLPPAGTWAAWVFSKIQVPMWANLMETEVYGGIVIPMMIAVLAAAVYLIWGAAGFAVASISLLRRRPHCEACGERVVCGFAVGRFCDACGESLAPWAYFKPSTDPGALEPAGEMPWTVQS
jgi:hypothetical protein